MRKHHRLRPRPHAEFVKEIGKRDSGRSSPRRKWDSLKVIDSFGVPVIEPAYLAATHELRPRQWLNLSRIEQRI